MSRLLLLTLLLLPASAVLAQSETDFDGDGVANASDSCPFAADPNQENQGGSAAGDACECGDLNGDGRVDLLDWVLLARDLVWLAPGIEDASKCSVTGAALDCDGGDATRIREALAGLGVGIEPVCVAASGALELPLQLSVIGDSLPLAHAADCTCNDDLFCSFCFITIFAPQPEHSFFDGTNVFSLKSRYQFFDGGIEADASSARSGAEMSVGPDSFSIQADRVLAQSPMPDLVLVALGVNELCRRGCSMGGSCASPLFDDAQWTGGVRAGLDKLVAGLPLGSIVYLLGVPRVQDLRDIGLQKSAESPSVDCPAVWQAGEVCEIVTVGGDFNDEDLATRLAAVAERQQRYNEILRDEAWAYWSNDAGQNPRGIEVFADYLDEQTLSLGTVALTPDDVNGGDCFHPSVSGQQRLADIVWFNSPAR